MTDEELTRAVRSIWKKACRDVGALVKAQGVTVFDSWYSLHRYVKHRDCGGIVSDGEDLLQMFLNEHVRPGDKFVIATPDKIAAERKKIRSEAVDDCRKAVATAKLRIIENESRLRELLSSKNDEDIDYDD